MPKYVFKTFRDVFFFNSEIIITMKPLFQEVLQWGFTTNLKEQTMFMEVFLIEFYQA